MESKEILEQLYYIEKLSTVQIAKVCAVTPATVAYWFKKYGLILRSLSEALRQAPKRSYTKNKILTYCATCNTKLLRWPYRIANNTKHFCNTKCKGLYASKYLVQENAYNWKGGYWSKCSQKIMWTTYRTLRKKILSRDLYTCTICGSKKDLQVHHKVSRKLDPTLTFTEDNLVTVCSICHKNIHRYICKGGELLETP